MGLQDRDYMKRDVPRAKRQQPLKSMRKDKKAHSGKIAVIAIMLLSGLYLGMNQILETKAQNQAETKSPAKDGRKVKTLDNKLLQHHKNYIEKIN